MSKTKIISFNLNGIRAAERKGLQGWLKKESADIFCFQEIRAYEDQIPSAVKNMKKYYTYFNPALKKGYAGTALFVKEKPLSVKKSLGWEKFDQEGRIMEAEYQDFVLINLYLPNGGRKQENMDYKLQAYDCLFNYLKKIISQGKPIILTGDFNVAHQDIDLARPKANKKNTMFTPAERKKIDQLVDLGFKDSWRELNSEPGHYTWWSHFAQARQRNIGWRIDYVFLFLASSLNLHQAYIYPQVMLSDHCPIGVEVNS
ncbi:exodeoxyribonuclease III [Patescibacteria group bacterium]|nr:exodeoxyribonuclease III [Patescibacteria group bacterium]